MRDISKMQGPNDGTRTLVESIMAPEVLAALRDWHTSANPCGVLIGGLALSHYAKPRYTQDIDVLYLTEAEVPIAVNGFKKTRAHAFQHRATGVEVEVLTASFLGMSEVIVSAIIETALMSDGVKIASRSGLIASKLFRFNRRDQADIEDLITDDVDISGYALPQKQVENYISIVSEN